MSAPAVCPDHGVDLVVVAQYAAPGVGLACKCPTDGRDWAVVYGQAFDPEEMVHVGGPEDFR